MSNELKILIEAVKNTPVREEFADGLHYKKHPLRQEVRYKLIRYRTMGDVMVPGLIEFFEKQFRSGWSWDNFSHDWDISPSDPLRAIPEREWLTEGGAAVDPREGEVFTAARFHPNAFTRQTR